MQSDCFIMSKNIAKIRKILKNFPNKKILVIGDIMLDHYIYGNVTRISPEAPVPILNKTDEDYVLGGAGNVANNLASLGAKVSLAGIVGDDYGFKILNELFLKANINTEAILVISERSTIQKERLVVKYQHIIRLDTEDTSSLNASEEKELLDLVRKQVKLCDGIILSDYAKGLFSLNLAQSIIKLAKKFRKPIFADIKPKNKEFFRGVDVIAPNLKEALEMTGAKDLYSAGNSLADYYKADVVVTKSEQGISIFKPKGKSLDVPTKSVTVVDVSGAGDTFMAAQCLALIAGFKIEEASFIGAMAGTIAVQKPGTSIVTLEELESAMRDDNDVEAVDVVPKLWGYEKWLENNDKYCCKLLSLNKGYQCSLHYHKDKDEMFFVTKGHVRLELEDNVVHMRAGNFMRITPGSKHRFIGVEDSIIIEVSTHHEESDSYRIENAKKVE